MAIPKPKKRILGEEFDWVWTEDDIAELKQMYDMNIPVTMIAQNFGRKCIEVGIAIAILAEEGELEPRPTGVYGRGAWTGKQQGRK